MSLGDILIVLTTLGFMYGSSSSEDGGKPLATDCIKHDAKFHCGAQVIGCNDVKLDAPHLHGVIPPPSVKLLRYHVNHDG